jgi:methyl-accepting chemotaxis protein
MDASDIDRLLDSPMAALTDGLRSLDQNQGRALSIAMQAMAAGDFTVELVAGLEPLDAHGHDAETQAIVDLINSLQTRLNESVVAYESLRRDLARALGDHSCLPDLLVALQSLNAHCLTDLDTGLQAMADGDYTLSARPVTHPLRCAPGDALGEVAEVFNEMLARSRTALRSYDAVREDLRSLLGDHSCLDALRIGLRSLQRHCLRDLEEALEAMVEGTALTRSIAPATVPIATPEGALEGELAGLFNRALARAQAAVGHLIIVRERRVLP